MLLENRIPFTLILPLVSDGLIHLSFRSFFLCRSIECNFYTAQHCLDISFEDIVLPVPNQTLTLHFSSVNCFLTFFSFSFGDSRLS